MTQTENLLIHKLRPLLYDLEPAVFYEYIYAHSKTHTVSAVSCVMGYIDKRREEDDIEKIDLLLELFDPSQAVLTCSEGILLATQYVNNLKNRDKFLNKVYEYCVNIFGEYGANERLKIFWAKDK